MIILPANTLSTGGYEVANSCRFNKADSAYMHKTPSSAGNRRTFTFSFWIKRSTLGSGGTLFTAGAESDTEGFFAIYFVNADNLRVTFNESSSQETTTNAVFRDPSAWSHVVVAVDTTQGTASDRVKVYHNGTQITSFSGANYPSQNYECLVSNTNANRVGAFANSSGAIEGYFDGYMAEVCFIDGSALAPTSFGEFDEDSPRIWKPKDVSGLTFGTNGFYLDFEDSSNLGNDANGGTDLTEVNLAATDQATDTPTNNFATMNPLFARSDNVTFTEGNLKGALASEGNQIIASTIAVSAGKWYFEFQANAQEASAYMEVGIFPTYHTTVTPNYIGGLSDGYSLMKDGNFYNNGSATSTGVTYGTSDIMGVALDLDSGTKTIKYYKNGSLGTTQNITVTEDVYIGWRGFGSGEALSINFGSPKDSISSGNADGNGYGNMEYAIPANYYVLCSKNLAEFGG